MAFIDSNNLPISEEIPDAGMVNQMNADLPDEGVRSADDDIETTAQEGDFILPYETVLYVGLKDISDIVKKAIDQAQEEGVEINSQIDPDADVPIKISNYEYRVPKVLVPYIGLDLLNSWRKKGLELRETLDQIRSEKQGMIEQPQEHYFMRRFQSLAPLLVARIRIRISKPIHMVCLSQRMIIHI